MQPDRLRQRLIARNALLVQQLDDVTVQQRGAAWMTSQTEDARFSTASRAPSEPRCSPVLKPTRTHFGRRLRELREERGLRQKDLAVRSGLTQSAISYLESGGRVRPERETVLRLAEALELDISQTAAFLIDAAHSVQALLSEPVIVEALEYLRDAGDTPGARYLRQQVYLTLQMVRGEA